MSSSVVYECLTSLQVSEQRGQARPASVPGNRARLTADKECMAASDKCAPWSDLLLASLLRSTT